MDQNDFVLENVASVIVEGFETFAFFPWPLLILGLTGILTLILFILRRQFTHARDGFETIVAWLILGLTGFFIKNHFDFIRQITNDYGIGAGFQILAYGLQIYLIGLFTIIFTSQILKIILRSIIQ